MLKSKQQGKAERGKQVLKETILIYNVFILLLWLRFCIFRAFYIVFSVLTCYFVSYYQCCSAVLFSLIMFYFIVFYFIFLTFCSVLYLYLFYNYCIRLSL